MKKQLIQGLVFSIAGICMVVAFMPNKPDQWHYDWRILSECLYLLFAVIYTWEKRILSMVCLYWFLLALFAGYDDWFGDPFHLSLVEVTIFIILTIFFIYLIRKKWNYQT